MAFPHQPYGPLTTPQMSFLDDTFNAAGALGVVPCTASGTNAITLTTAANTPTISAYSNFLLFSFTAANASTGAVTLGVGALPVLNLYNNGGTVQSNTGDIQANQLYIIAYNLGLNGGAGGFVIVSAISSQSFVGGTLTSLTNMSGAAFNEASAPIASSGTTNIGGAAANYLIVSGTATITAFDTVQAGTMRVLKFTTTGGVLTSNAAIIIPGGVSYTWQAGDCFIFESEGAAVWRCVAYSLASGKSLSGSAGSLQQAVFLSTGTFTTPTGTSKATAFKWTIVGAGGGGGGAANNGLASGGGAGGTAIYWGSGVNGGTAITVTVSSGGNAGGSVPQNGSGGGSSSIVFNSVTVTGVGGPGGKSAAGGAIAAGVSGGGATNGVINIPGGFSGSGAAADSNVSFSAFSWGGPGGSTPFGLGGASTSTGGGQKGTGFGCGGSGAANGNSGGPGSNGIVLVEWIQ